MQYPLISEYLAAIREAHDNLDKLSHLVPVLDKYGEPYRSSGAFAVVFKMKDEQTGKCYALKCFTEEQEGRAEAYRQIAEELEFVDSPYITSVKYLEKEIFVDSNCEDEEFPVLLMDWIEGETMETYVADNYTDTHAMAMLCYRFCKMAAWLRSQSFAHGDIKPDNIMVRPDGTLTLVDYDGMFVPAMKGQKSPTIGTKDFSHPLRTIDDFDETIDDFALASIALSLKAISLNPSLLQTYGASDRLLFSAADYLDLSKSKTFTALQGLLVDEEAITLMSMFLLASAQKNLSMCSFRLFGVEKPKEEDVWSTEVTDEDLENAVEDEFGVKYSKDWKRLLKAPESLSGKYTIRKGVKVIGNSAFWLCSSLTNINIPNSVTNIGYEAFCLCRSLTNINIPNGVTNIGYNAFSDCRSLTNINIPNSVTNIGDAAFSGCSSLTNINIPNSVKYIGDIAFSGCNSLTKIKIPSSVVYMDGYTFLGWDGDLYNESKAFIYEHQVLFNKDKTTLIAYRSKEKNYIIPNSVTNIGNAAFSGCSSLTKINIPNSVTNIGNEAFECCRSLTKINIPNSVTNIGKRAFLLCRSLTKINIPNSVTNIGDEAFSGCSSLTNINIPNSVTNIGYNAFYDCRSLTNINIPNGVTYIGYNAFQYCYKLTSIKIPSSVVNINGNPFCRWNGDLYNESKAFIYEHQVLFNKDKTTLIAYISKEKNYIIPNSVTNIGDGAFWDCESLTSINIPDGVTNIGNGAFLGCKLLTNINIPDGVTNIGNAAFWGCESLTSINIPNSVTAIGNWAFEECKNLPSKTKSDIINRFGKEAFQY
ncbi:leucine-rich repeat protein [Leyella stercorea]|uniref:leucine-rich repeat protein n=1 Tax=Leyella stercorea TaxID=363265 RepID=UPI0024322373|nr:leucine-rich repeat protein [Leyella stercorea]